MQIKYRMEQSGGFEKSKLKSWQKQEWRQFCMPMLNSFPTWEKFLSDKYPGN